MSFENVVLQYAHPCIAGIFVEDNTTYEETFLSAEEPVKLLQCGVFASGRDNQLLYCENYDQFINEFGKPNYSLYGQAGYNIANALKTGYAAAYVMRVMPDDATFANVVVMATYGVGDNEDGSGSVMNITYSFKTIENATSVDELAAEVDALRMYDPDDNGNYTNPLFYVYQTGRGQYGNATRVRMADVTAYDDEDNTNRTYRFDVLQMGTALTRLEYAFGCFNPDLFDTTTSESLYLGDLINDVENGMTKVNVGIVDATVNAMVDMYNETFETSETTSTLDIMFGRNMDGTTNNNLVIVNDLTNTDGVSLNSGFDGSLDASNADRNEVISDCLVKAYNGTYDKHIKSRYSTPADFMTDANFDKDVKIAMVALAMEREWDAMCYIDAGLLSTVDETIAWLEEMADYSANNVIKELHNYKIRDTEYTGKTIPVTTTYYIAGRLPHHFKTRGLNTPMVLEDARITNAVKGSFQPVIDPDEDDIKAEIYKLRGNYYETVKYNVYQRGCCITTQKTTSDRLDEFNEYILQLAVKTAVEIMRSKIYKFGEPDDRANYKALANQKLQYLLGPLVRSISVDFTMSKTDERRNIMRIVLRIVYKTVVKRGIVEIYLDPRA